ncbi:serine/threonine-protein kinase [Caballeronia sp. Sq4a]|uniref:serine/threonine protein kinase n=1 Tax=Caballeronia sp. Sq4a TaxID=2878152 RepID=UPI0020BF40CE|nr:serine/threonine-protein kinase [Caballeronia sp. Sq4a]
MNHWVDVKKWSERWERIEALGSGGQGDVFKAKRLTDGHIACLKVLSKQSDVERRARFLREAAAYQTCHHELVPHLVESNAIHEDKYDYKLFIVTELIVGPTLTKPVAEQGALRLADAIKLTIRLLSVLQYLHKEGWVHRDIKPDNIVVRDRDIHFPVLLDFGLCYRDGAHPLFETESGQEVGNRFLRLPELGIGSENKHDVRSDIAFAAGVLFYALTTELPAMPFDSSGLMPHQRPEHMHALKNAAGEGSVMALFHVFDRALHLNPGRRFNDALEMIEALKRLAAINAESPLPEQADLDFVLAHIRRQATREQVQLTDLCEAGMEVIGNVHSRVAAQVRPSFVTVQTNYKTTPFSIENTLGFANATDTTQQTSTSFAVEIVGGEVVILADRVPLYRTEVASPDYGAKLEEDVERVFWRVLRDLVEAPWGETVGRRYFKSPPFSNLSDAKESSSRSGKPTFIVVFNDHHPTKSKLDHTLGYFMEYQTTKDLVEHNFEVALIAAEPSHYPDLVHFDDPLEKPRWVVLAPDGTKLISETLYGNPDEGLKRIRAVLERWRTLRQAS